MNPTQNNQAGQHDYVKEHAAHHFKRKWLDATLFDHADQADANEGHVMKAPHTSPSTGNDDSVQKIDLEEDDEEVKIKRKEQNRLAQRNFRERKERYVKDLEIKIKQAQENHLFATNQLYQENHHLRAIICRLEAENTTLKGMMPMALSTNTVDNSRDLFSSLGLVPQQQQLPGLGLPPLSSFYTPDVFPPIQPTRPTAATYPKPLAAKPPVPILPNQPIITAPPVASLHKKEPQASNDTQPQEFTFSITTPATLRANTSNTPSDPIELVSLYHPDHSLHSAKSSSSSSSSSSSASHSASPSTEQIIPPADLLDKAPTFLDGYDAFERLYVHQDASLFDDHGLDLVQRTTTTTMDDDLLKDKKTAVKKDKAQSGSAAPMLPHRPPRPQQHQERVVVEDDEKTPIWQKITEHAQNNKFSVDHLVEAVRHTTTSKRKNKLLVDEWELEAMVHDLNYYL